MEINQVYNQVVNLEQEVRRIKSDVQTIKREVTVILQIVQQIQVEARRSSR